MTNVVAKRLSRFNCGQGKFFLLLSTESRQNGLLRLTLTDGGKSWSGKINERDFSEWSERTKLSPSDYRSQTMKALSGESFNGRNFVYEVQEERDGSAVLTWKRILDDEDIKFQLGSVNLRPDLDLAKSMSHILESSIQLTSQLQDNMQQLTEERDRLTSERAVALKRLEKFVSIKEDTERDLFSKFIVVINDKKAKIRELKQKLEQCSPQETISTARPPSGPEKNRKSHAVSSDDGSGGESPLTLARTRGTDSEAEYDTDDEMKKSSHCAKNTRCRDERAGTSNSGRRADANEEESDGLILDDADDDDDNCLAAVQKRPRKTKAQTVARKNSSKTRIPVSDPQPSSARRSASLRKTASKGSSHNLDVSNLIDDMD